MALRPGSIAYLPACKSARIIFDYRRAVKRMRPHASDGIIRAHTQREQGAIGDT